MAAIGQSRPAPATNIRTPMFVAGVALSLVAFLVMFAFGLIFAGRLQAPGQLSVVVASQTIQPRTPIDPSMLKLASVPTSAVPPRAFAREADLNGQYALVTILQGEPVTANLVSTNPDLVGGAETSYLPIPKGLVAMALPASELSDVGGYPAQGDYIDVVSSIPLKLFSPNDPRTITVIVFTNLYIIRVGPQSAVARQGQPQGVTSSITVVLTPCDAVYLKWLQDNTTLTFLLISYTDYQTSPPPSPTASQSPASGPSAGCPSSVGPAQANGRWKFTGP